MALARGRRLEPVNYWPGFVDALSTMLLIIIFLLSVFMLSQYFLSREVTGKDTALEKLNRQIEELTTMLAMERSQLAAIQQALDISKTSEQEAQGKITDLGQRLNLALAQKVQELSRYRSDFFGRLRQILGNRPDIAVVGDRFVFQSSVLFDPGKADLSESGRKSLDRLADAALDLEREVPPDIPWVLRIDGHTDAQPIGSGPFKSNWE